MDINNKKQIINTLFSFLNFRIYLNKKGKTNPKYTTKRFGYKEKTKKYKKSKYTLKGIHKVEKQKIARKTYKSEK